MPVSREKTGKAIMGVADVAKRITDLSPRRQEIVRPIFESPRDFVLLSIRATSEKLRTDAAFLLRTIQQLGFRSYGSFKQYLHELAISNATSLERMQEQGEKLSSPEAMLRATMERSMMNLTALRNTLDPAQVLALAQRLHKARRIVLLAGDLATTLAGYLEYQLIVLGLPAFAATGSGRMVHTLRTTGPGDVVFAMSFRRGLRATVEGLKDARSRKAYCVGLTDTSISPIARFSDEHFVVSIEGEALRSSYVAPLAFADVLIAACANVRREDTLKLLDDVSKEQKHGYRWYEG
jgi:RpiR family transcriptional regulator, carbohydrate utilization regulator